MPLDAICLHGVLKELQADILGVKIDKVAQPDKDKIVLTLRAKGFSGKLLLAAGTGSARIHLTQESYENPQKPPMFCMLLRKHIAGGRIKALAQVPFERVVRVEIESYDELGQLQEKTLVLEMLGGSCNLILLDGSGMILEALRRVDYDPVRGRGILPGLKYQLPKAQEKKSPYLLGQEVIENVAEKPLANYLIEQYKGLSPLVAREISYQAFGGETVSSMDNKQEADFKNILLAFSRKIQDANFTPYLLEKQGEAFDFSYMPIKQYETLVQGKVYESFSSLLDVFYKNRNRQEKNKQQAGNLKKNVGILRDKLVRKITLQEKEKEESQKRETFRQWGDIITANLYQLQGGEQVLQAENFYDPENKVIEIPLDTQKSPQQNAAYYYKRYSKLKTAQKHLEIQMEKAQGELLYLESVLETIEKAETNGDVSAIGEELAAEGYIRKAVGKKQKPMASVPMEFLSTNGFPIFAGKNNLQNDKLTFKLAHKADLWFHTQKIHGSHVIIGSAGRPVDEKTIEEAAHIAAYYSKGKDSSNVPVDYVAVKFVKKPAGGKPGAAHYTNQNTIFVSPNGALVESLRKK